jgi:AraC-like DNA-binding protein
MNYGAPKATKLSPMANLLLSKCLSLAPTPNRYNTNINRLHIVHYDSYKLVSIVLKPSFFFILRGFCHLELGLYQKMTLPQSFLVIGPQLPVVCRILANQEQPLIVMVLSIDLELLRGLSDLTPNTIKRSKLPESSVTFGPIDNSLTKLLLNLLNCRANSDAPLDQTPEEIIHIYNFFLRQPFPGGILRRVARSGISDVLHSIDWFNHHFNEPLSVADMAAKAEMPLTTYHRHFKNLTTLSPLQFIKTTRLFEARRLMLFYGKTANVACQEVGYESPSQFNREYKRFFYMPPHRDVTYNLYVNPPVYQPLSLTHIF